MEQISKEECKKIHDNAGELLEAFEIMSHHKFYLDVLYLDDKIVGRLIELDLDCTTICNCSYAFEKIDGKYAIEHAVDDNVAVESFFVYDDLEDAKRHAMSLIVSND